MTNANNLLLYPDLQELRHRLIQGNHRLVLAESCTSGLVAAEIGQIPGISAHFCGSMVVYRNQTKIEWAGISKPMLDDPNIGPVSEQASRGLVKALLERTTEANLAAAITGHLGPGSPIGLDGAVYCAVTDRVAQASSNASQSILVHHHQLESPVPQDADDWGARRARQLEATRLLIQTILHYVCHPSVSKLGDSKPASA